MLWKSKKKNVENYVFDSYAILAFLESEKGGEVVRDLLENTKTQFFISTVNLGEVYYIILRERGRQTAESIESELMQADNICVVNATWERSKAAGELKARGGISYADCFAAALAIENNAPLLTGDKEFRKVEDKVKIIWLGEKGIEPT